MLAHPCLQVVLEVMRGGRPEVPTEDCLPPGTSSSTCEPSKTAAPCVQIAQFPKSLLQNLSCVKCFINPTVICPF